MRSATVRHVAFALAFVVVGLLGRTTIYDKTDTSLVWPAAGVAVLWWLATAREQRWPVVAALGVLSFTVNRATGADNPLSWLFAIANALQVVGIGMLLEHDRGRWLRVSWHGRFNRTAHLMRLAAASIAGTAVPAVIGVVGLWVLRDFITPASALTWWGRNAVGSIGVVAAGLVVLEVVRWPADALRPQRSGKRSAWLECVALVASTVALVVVDLADGYLPLSFFLPALTVWAGIRFPPVVAALHALLAGSAAVTLTLQGQGPFSSVGDAHLAVLLSQLFVAITVVTGLFLALSRAENDLLTEQLRAERESLAGYARTAAHDLLNPLTAIRGWIEIIEDTPPGNSPDRIAVQRVASAAARMQALVRDLLTDAQSHELALRREVVDMTALAMSAAEIHPTVSVKVEPLPEVMGDAGMLEQVLSNLIGNAVKYAAPERDPEITISGFHRGDGTPVVQVCDRGIGIPPELLRSVFESFQRVPGTERPGTGLGLAICKRIVERHGGTITARPRDDGPGTIIEMTLPGTAG